jgi:hypothetical protein
VPWHQVPELLRDLDVNLAPLTPGSRFNEAKSAIKWLEAALTETPTVASPTEPFRDALADGVNGLLARTEDDWFAAIDGLLRDPLRRRRMGSRARRDALLGWSPHLQARRYLGLLETARSWPAERARRLASYPRWEPVVHDDPLVPHGLEPYALPDAEAAPAPAPTLADKVRYIGSRLRHTVRDEGLLSAVRRSGPWFALWARQWRDRLLRD